MQLEIFTLCDAATEHAGRLNIMGTFDSLRAFAAPISHPQCAIAGRLRFEQIEEGEHRVMLMFADEDGNIVMPRIRFDLGREIFAGIADGAAGQWVVHVRDGEFNAAPLRSLIPS